MESIINDSCPRLKPHPYYRYYRVNKNDTALHAFSANDFRPRPTVLTTICDYSLLPGWQGYYQYADIGQAMEKAKSGALNHIEQLITGGEASLPELLQYRMDHYEDLQINLVYSNIQLVEASTISNTQFTWHPYRIHN
ncbi:hypothetical protein [Mucilaginibacter sp. FT3.2]|uniref:hypothetical protein n=1 Tax=Mucilaginibacter sp. FT3.2 TaxID=2723090 RepID=UPI0016183073|nr:hypothetical protein [Mucilaginibacter sp. FT3.2]MBB6232417.1 hypothetical protein [Mucilaginibacter sp. FT3.2]